MLLEIVLHVVALQAHAAKSQKDMSAKELFDTPQQVEFVVIKPNKQALGKAYKQKAKEIQAALEGLCDETALQLKVSSPNLYP